MNSFTIKISQDGGFLLLILLVWLALSITIRVVKRNAPQIASLIQFSRNGILPTAILLLYLNHFLRFSADAATVRIIQTIFWVQVIWVAVSFAKIIVTSKISGAEQQNLPILFLDLIRFAIIILGTFLVIAGVWKQDLSVLLTTVGFGSIVLGLALQDTLGNLFSGVALFFERPFNVGDWVRVGQLEGRVTEINWRAVHITTRLQDTVVTPNSVIARDQIENMSEPPGCCGTHKEIGFSYDDSPSKVKRVLLKALFETRGVRRDPPPMVYTTTFADSAIIYKIKFFVDSVPLRPVIEDEFMTKVWYAARRNNLTIPYPTRTVYKTEMRSQSDVDPKHSVRELLAQVPLLAVLSSEELQDVAREAQLQEFTADERIIVEGQSNDALYIIQSGSVRVTRRTASGSEEELVTLSTGDFYGEMSLLTGEPTTASVIAREDLKLIVIYTDTFQLLLSRSPSLAEKIADVVEKRKNATEVLLASKLGSLQTSSPMTSNDGPLINKIKKFLHI